MQWIKNHSSDQVKPSNNTHTLTCTYPKVSQRIANVVFWKLGIGPGKPALGGSHLLQSLANTDSITLAAGLNIESGLLSG
ncbi:hypothetical protein N7516_002652 [Penicillium verrucosum]|uniref:uncharacterized protein n=1 Tax=Penicillium verrucosum TaxID=60171 RepID=UPI002545B163|nr:uncharacterized protein N7516_002652 [Penicillium verrucosum]KAJ5942484.1 hypothetical protein N7516_002652 [Penicillium verrucosum]